MSVRKTKCCTKCQQRKRLTSFSYDRRRPEGRQSHCRVCMAVRVRRYIRRNKEKVREAKRAYYLRNAEKIKATVRLYEMRNPKRVLDAHRRWRSRNRSRANAYSMAWYTRNKEQHRAIASRWAKKNPEKAKANTYRRLARLKSAPGAFTGKQLLKVLEKYGRRCVYCGEAYECIDHVIPLSRGGSNYPSNLRPSCLPCNSSKGAKFLSEWPGRPRMAA